MAQGDIISSVDYNTIRLRIAEVMGTGAGTYGYGQAMNSSDVAITQKITKEQWDNLRFDIVNAIVHQTGEAPTITTVQVSDPIRYGAGHPNYQYNTITEQARIQRFDIGAGQFVVSSATAQSRSTAWSSTVTCTLTVTFGTVDQARFFFNSGGKIRISSARSGGAGTSQNSNWTTLLSNVGSKDFGATGSLNFYNLTSSYQSWFTGQASISPAYSSNYFNAQVKCNVANNSGGTANVVTFLFSWVDPYTDPGSPAPGDEVDGTLSLTVSEIRAAGTLLPTGLGSFTIASPSYSISTISGS